MAGPMTLRTPCSEHVNALSYHEHLMLVKIPNAPWTWRSFGANTGIPGPLDPPVIKSALSAFKH
eukprot:6784557-Alexandrium_andersonii.AAC.1